MTKYFNQNSTCKMFLFWWKIDGNFSIDNCFAMAERLRLKLQLNIPNNGNNRFSPFWSFALLSANNSKQSTIGKTFDYLSITREFVINVHIINNSIAIN